MELMQLEMFVAVVEERSFLRAAVRVFRTQPAVSISLRKLEGRIGIPLLDRSHRQSGHLTPAGEVLYEYASRILELRDEVLSALKKEDRSYPANLCIGVTSGDNFERIPELTRRFSSQYPNVRLEILCDRPVNLFRNLTERRMDIVLVSGRPKGDVQSKTLIVTRVRVSRPHGAFWVVRRRLGQSPLAYAFEESLMRNFKSAKGARNAKQIELRTVSIGKGATTNRFSPAENASR
jgi:DNA-binding transcriptional LysR family regulator